MAYLLSGGFGLLLGVVYARLALRPLLVIPFKMSPLQLVSRFLIRILALSAVLVILTTRGASLGTLLLSLVVGFVAQSTAILLRGTS